MIDYFTPKGLAMENNQYDQMDYKSNSAENCFMLSSLPADELQNAKRVYVEKVQEIDKQLNCKECGMMY